jgi:hypothetical protein
MPLNTLNSRVVKKELADSVVRRRVRFSQEEAKCYADKHRNAKVPTIQAGDYVRVSKQSVPHKLAPVWSKPLRVSKVNGASLLLENGQRWNVRKCLLHKPALKNRASVPDGGGTVSVHDGEGKSQQSSVEEEEEDMDVDNDIAYTFVNANVNGNLANVAQNAGETRRRTDRISKPVIRYGYDTSS